MRFAETSLTFHHIPHVQVQTWKSTERSMRSVRMKLTGWKRIQEPFVQCMIDNVLILHPEPPIPTRAFGGKNKRVSCVKQLLNFDLKSDQFRSDCFLPPMKIEVRRSVRLIEHDNARASMPVVNLDDFDSLPTELILLILSLMDVLSLLKMRLVSKARKDLAESTPVNVLLHEYPQEVIPHYYCIHDGPSVKQYWLRVYGGSFFLPLEALTATSVPRRRNLFVIICHFVQFV